MKNTKSKLNYCIKTILIIR